MLAGGCAGVQSRLVYIIVHTRLFSEYFSLRCRSAREREWAKFVATRRTCQCCSLCTMKAKARIMAGGRRGDTCDHGLKRVEGKASCEVNIVAIGLAHARTFCQEISNIFLSFVFPTSSLRCFSRVSLVRYAPDRRWRIDTLITMLSIAGNHCNEVCHRSLK